MRRRGLEHVEVEQDPLSDQERAAVVPPALTSHRLPVPAGVGEGI